jgi:hypothetical protein
MTRKMKVELDCKSHHELSLSESQAIEYVEATEPKEDDNREFFNEN